MFCVNGLLVQRGVWHIFFYYVCRLSFIHTYDSSYFVSYCGLVTVSLGYMPHLFELLDYCLIDAFFSLIWVVMILFHWSICHIFCLITFVVGVLCQWRIWHIFSIFFVSLEYYVNDTSLYNILCPCITALLTNMSHFDNYLCR